MLVVRDSLGRVILENTQSREPDQIDAFEKKEDIHPTTADDFYMLGVKQENFDNREQAKEAYMNGTASLPITTQKLICALV